MSAEWATIFHEIIFGIFSTVFNLLKVLIPLMIIVEILMVYKLLEKLSAKLEFLSTVMGMKKEAIFPLLVAVVMGVTFGAGTLIEINNQTPISKKDFALIGIFIFLCHGIIETGFLFAINGASVIVITVGRLFIAFIVTVIAARLPIFRRMEE